jgi:hypothetical protein
VLPFLIKTSLDLEFTVFDEQTGSIFRSGRATPPIPAEPQVGDGGGRTRWILGDVERLITNALDPILRPAGFRYRRKSGAFVRKIPGGKQELSVALWGYRPPFEFSFTLCVRLDAVEEITNQFAGVLPKYYGETLTSMTQLEFLDFPRNERGECRYGAESEPELLRLLPGVCALVRDRVLPFFEEHQDIQSLNRGLNPPGSEGVFQRSWPSDRRAFAGDRPYRAMTGVAVAYLAGDPRLSDLIAAYRSQLSGMHEEYRQRFEETAGNLPGTPGA